MSLGVIPMFCFENLEIFGEKSLKSKEKILGTSGFYAAAWDALPWRGRGAKIGTPRVATPRRRHCS